jgi:arylamine N-acetyltransferase
MTAPGPPLTEVLERWGCHESGPPDEEHLRRLHHAWLDNVPFENITKLMGAHSPGGGEPTRTLVQFWTDHLKWNSGGTCFDSAAAFRQLLEARDFSPRYVFCRLPGKGERSHVALLVTVGDDDWLVDVGYALPEPIPLPRSTTVRRQTPLYDVELRRGPEGEHLLFTEDGRGSRFRYSVAPVPATPAGFQAAWLDTFLPGAPYMSRLALGRFRGEARYIYKNASSLYVLSRTEAKLLAIPDPGVPHLSRIFGIEPELLEAGLDLVNSLNGRPCAR